MSSYTRECGPQNLRAEHRSFLNLSAVPVLLALLAGWVPQHALATTSDTQFQQYITNVCNQAGPNAAPSAMCANSRVVGAGGGTVAGNLGTVNAATEMSLRRKYRIHGRLHQHKPDKGASADGGAWGFLVTPQYGRSDRPETDLGNGYQSELTGLSAGLDYRFSDSFVLGGTLGQTRDNANFVNAAGSLKTVNNAFTMYGTWIPTENVAVDGYLGYGKSDFNSQRNVLFGPLSGMTSGSTTGNQFMAGLSASYQKDFGRVNLSPFVNLDFIKTNIGGYNESGTTTLEMRYGNRSAISLISSLGGRVSTSYGHEWGSLIPSARLAFVHEFQNRASQFNAELVSTPGTGIMLTTDSADRNYLSAGLGVAAALNGGTQLFLDYEKITQDRLLNSWAISAGVLLEF